MKKKILYFLIVFFIGIISLFAIDSIHFKTLRNKKSNDLLLHLTYNITDSSSVKNMDEDYNLIFSQEGYIKLNKENDYYVGYLNNSNSELVDNIVDYQFAKNNVLGQLIKDAKFDKKNKKVYIPAKYYKSTKIKIPIQLQVLVYKKKFKQISINVKQQRFFRKKRTYKINTYNDVTGFYLYKYKKELLYKSDLLIFINDNKIPIDDSSYTFDKESGKLVLNISPHLINNIEIKIKKKSILNNFSIKHIFASTDNDVKAQATLDDGSSKNIPVGTTFTVNAKVYYDYGSATLLSTWDSECDNGKKSSCKKYEAYKKVLSKNSAPNGTTHTNSYITNSAAYTDFAVDLSDISTSKKVGDTTYTLNFDSYTYVVTHCTESSKPAGTQGGSQSVTLTVKRSTSDILVVDIDNSHSLGGQQFYGHVAFDYPEDEGYVKIKKTTLQDRNIEGIEFRLYTDSSCSESNRIGRKWTNKYGNVTWKGLEKGSVYYFKEIPNQIFTGEGTDKDCEQCTKVKAKKLDDTDETVPVSVTCINKRKRYSFTIHKTDKNNSSLGVSGALYTVYYNASKDEDTLYYDRTHKTYTKDTAVETEFVSNNGNIKSDANGNVTICGLPDKQTYYVKETGNENPLYYNDSPSTKYVIAKDDVTDYTYTCPTPTAKVTNSNTHKKWCIKVVKKDKDTQQPITGSGKAATFQLCSDAQCNTVLQTKQTNTSNGVATFMGLTHDGTSTTGGSPYYVRETVAPTGYAVGSSTPKQVNNVTLLALEKVDSTNEADCNSNPELMIFDNPKLVINWYKSYEDTSTRAGTTSGVGRTEFKVKNSAGKYLVYSGTERVTDASNPGVTKTCYKYSSTSDTITGGSVFKTGENGETGGVCISGVSEGTYTVIETSPPSHHALGNPMEKNITASAIFNSNTIFTNNGTYIEVEKKVTDGERVGNALDDTVLYKIETNKLKTIPFVLYKSDANKNIQGTPLSFVLRDGVYYDLSAPDISLGANEQATTILYLNDERRIKFSHLSWGESSQDYVLKEYKNEGNACGCENEGKCIGYYMPSKDQEVKFTITKCSNPNSVSKDTANSKIGAGTCSITYSQLAGQQDNTPTELWFTKKDFYGYEDSEDIADQTVDFVDEKERSDFDRITFKVKDESGNYLKFIDIGDHSTTSNICSKDADYREYRYITDDELALLSAEERAQLEGKIVTELHTCGGHIRITNLCRGKKFIVEEVAVPEDSVFTLPEDNNPATSEYTIPCCDEDPTPGYKSHTIIKDKGTRVRFEKRDSKYNYLIPDETTTFQVYQCEKGVECHPTDNLSDMEHAAGVKKIMLFRDKAMLTAEDRATPLDQEDGKNGGNVTFHTAAGDDYEDVYKVYKAASDTDVAKEGTSNFVTDLHPDKGVLILRYLPAGYNYVLVETVSPQGYSLPNGRGRETKFTVVNNTVKVEEVNVPNKPVSLLVRKYSDDGKLLEGATFTIAKAKTCNTHIEPQLVETYPILKLKTIRDGVYELRETGDTTSFKTCTDRPDMPCNQINSTLTHTSENAYENYTNTVGDFNRLVNDRLEQVQIEAGEALIQYLDYGSCYVIEEIKAPNGYSLPEKAKDRFSMIKITDKEQIFDTYTEFINKPTPFTFFKLDEYNKALDGGKYKLQKLNRNKIYEDVNLTKEVTESGELYYKVDKNGTDNLMETKNGKATIYYLEEGQYRVLEVEAPAGYELPKKTMNVVTFFVDGSGRVYGSSIIANKPKTEKKIGKKPEASAKFILGVDTGQKVIKYGLIITVIVLAIAGLIYVQRKTKK